jgi:hypothetical protein
MNWLPPILVKVSALVLPGDIKARQKQPHVIELAESIRERTGKRPIHLPTIEYPSKVLKIGGDRVAAQLLNGVKSLWVQPVSQATPKEWRDMIRDENLHRRVSDRDELVLQRVTERAAEIEAERASSEADGPRAPGRPKTAMGEAREQVARELGTTPDAIRVAAARAEADEEIVDKYPDTPRQCPVETYGLQLVADEEADRIRAVQVAIDSADQFLRRAQAALAGLEVAGPTGWGVAQVLTMAVHKIACDVRAVRPTAVCPYCKHLPGWACRGCGGSGFVGEDVMLGVADELKLGGKQAMVATANGLVSYATARGAAQVPEPSDDEGIPF